DELDPLGTHIPDWENATLRILNSTGQVLQVTGTAHGDVRDLSLIAALTYENGNHPVVYASRNGHSVWDNEGDNPINQADFTKELKIPFGLFDIDLGGFGVKMDGLNITNKGVRFDASNAFQVMSVYDTCVDRTSAMIGMCEAINPVQTPDLALDNT